LGTGGDLSKVFIFLHISQIFKVKGASPSAQSSTRGSTSATVRGEQRLLRLHQPSGSLLNSVNTKYRGTAQF
jgi:hypothetical protein